MNSFQPFLGFPPFKKPKPYYLPYNNIHNTSQTAHNFNEKTYTPSDFLNKGQDNDDCFEIFGLKLYSDDLLIIFLLFFLYNENVKDTYLYIALILLLIS